MQKQQPKPKLAEERKEPVNLERDFRAAMKGMMDYLMKANPKKIDELAEVYELVNNYRTDPENYLKKDIAIDYYVETQKHENWAQRHMQNIESFGKHL